MSLPVVEMPLPGRLATAISRGAEGMPFLVETVS